MLDDSTREAFTFPASRRARTAAGLAAGLATAAFVGVPATLYWAGGGPRLDTSVEGVLWVEPGTETWHITAVTSRGSELRNEVPEVTASLWDNLLVVVEDDGRFVRLTIDGHRRSEAAEALNAIMTRYVELAAERKALERRNEVEILESQLAAVESEMAAAERRMEEVLENQRVARLPSEAHAEEEARLRRRIERVEHLQMDVRSRLEGARLAAAAAVPPVRVVSRARPDR